MNKKAWTEKFMRGVFFIAACASVLAVALICIFLFANGIPAMKEIGFGKFLTGQMWRPKNQIFGIFPMIIGSNNLRCAGVNPYLLILGYFFTKYFFLAV